MSPEAGRVLSIVLTGRGGQGVKLSSELLAWSASADGYNPIQYSVYGALIRGGEIACSLAASREDPGVPLRSDYALMCAMHNDWFDRYYPLLLPGGLLAYDVANIDEAWLTRGDIEHVAVPVAEMTAEAGDVRAGNMVVAGVVARLTGLASRQALTTGMTEVVPAHRADRISRNLAAVEVGYSWVERTMPDAFVTRRLT
jgi:2-oxoglutarate ferredoxin oxidoreductase subunit gamma